MQRIYKGSQTARNKSLKPALDIASPYIEMAVAAKTKNPEIGRPTGNFLKSISGGRALNLTKLHGNELRLKVM